MKLRKRPTWHGMTLAGLVLAGAAQVAQIVMTALGAPADPITVIVQSSVIVLLCLMCVGHERQLHGRRSTLEKWSNALDGRHVMLDRREAYLEEVDKSLAWWKGELL